ncbi:FtsX-like permease family protein [Litorisediminicola beolgyonensis]|uniref:FtsX-like permease family protein n=1 Tax=Litorisediminicola beolgyonensis TaxID=1173614 RepID=A0ABW3ZFT4_9RHOB
MTRAGLAVLWSHWRRHPLQLATLVLGLALATALWSGVQAINAEARASYSDAAGALGQAPLDELTAPDGIPLDTYAALRRQGYLVTPRVSGPWPGAPEITLRGIDPLTAPPEAGTQAYVGDGEVLARMLSQPGLLLAAPETRARLPEDAPPSLAAPGLASGVVLTDVVTALRLLGTDRLDALAVYPEKPRGLPPLSEAPDLTLRRAEDGSDLAELTRSFHLNLTAFGLLSFAVGLFIVQSAIGLAFEQRRATIRTLRALGLSLGRTIALLASELAVIALGAGLLGVALGYAVAAALLPGVAGTLRGLYGAQVSGQLNFDPAWAAWALVIALVGAAVAGAQALWQVARMPLLAPAQPRAWAMASARVLRWQALGAAALLTLSALLVILGDGLIAAFACLGALLIGSALALPPFLTLVLKAVSRLRMGPVGDWLIADGRQQVPALSLALMALLLALAANIGVGTMVGSFRTTFTGWLDQRLAAELYVTAPDAETAAEVRALAEARARAVLPIWSVETTLRGQPGDVYGIVDDATYRDNWPLLSATGDVWDRLAAGDAALVNEQLARREDLALGDEIAILDGWRLPIAGIYSDYGNPEAQAFVAAEALAARVPPEPRLRFAIRIDPEAAPALAQELLEKTALPPAGLLNQAEVKRRSLQVFDRTFLVTGSLNVMTLGVAGFAMLTALLTLADRRLPQLAPVWALGLTPRRLATLELTRTALLAALTWALAVPVGLALAWVLLAVVNVEAFGWRLPMRLFPGELLRLFFWAEVAALVACAWPILRLTRLPAERLLRVFANDR